MKVADIYIERYDWHARVYLAVHGYYTQRILDDLSAIDCPMKIRNRVERNLVRGDVDTGFTYSNRHRRGSVVVVGLASSPAQFLNSFEHELRHLCDDIASACRLPMSGEDVAYLTGDVNSMLWGKVHDFVCCECQK